MQTKRFFIENVIKRQVSSARFYSLLFDSKHRAAQRHRRSARAKKRKYLHARKLQIGNIAEMTMHFRIGERLLMEHAGETDVDANVCTREEQIKTCVVAEEQNKRMIF